jgi:hypothetical protein
MYRELAEDGYNSLGTTVQFRGYNFMFVLNVASEEALPLPYSSWFSNRSHLR